MVTRWKEWRALHHAIPWISCNHGVTPMARNQPKGRSKMPITQGKLRAVRLELPEDAHKLLRLEAAKRDMSLMDLARELVTEALKRPRKPQGLDEEGY